MPFNSIGSNRDQIINITLGEREELLRRNVLLVDPRRQRPRWFNGRFLAARDLANGQNYFLLRQADHGRAAGNGVIEGLLVSEVSNVATNTDRIRIEAGHGVTDTGELVVLRDGILFDPANVPELQRLDAAFGLQPIPNEPGRVRTGLYIVALRPVEWTANPISAYPTSITGQRRVEDSDIVEGVAVSLIPLPGTPDDVSWTRRRARAAREIFVNGRNQGRTSGTLPLGIVALRGNLVEWVDPFLVRRETGAERASGMDFGFGNRSLNESFLVQYDRHLDDVLVAVNNQPFPATDWFEALPSVGRIPSNTMNGTNLTQRFFPAGIQVELAFLPEDELPALIEESLLLPPIDLTSDTNALEGTTVLVLVPMSRPVYNQNRAAVAGARPMTTPVVVNRSLARPIDILMGRASVFIGAGPVVPGPDDVWRQTLRASIQAQSTFWFVRRRHVPHGINVPGITVNASSAQNSNPFNFVRLIENDPEIRRNMSRLNELEALEVNALTRKLSDRRFVENPGLTRSILAKAAKAAEAGKPNSDVIALLAPIANPQLGEGLRKLAIGNPDLVHRLNAPTSDMRVLEDVDEAAAEIATEQLPDLAREINVRNFQISTKDLSDIVKKLRAVAPPPPKEQADAPKRANAKKPKEKKPRAPRTPRTPKTPPSPPTGKSK